MFKALIEKWKNQRRLAALKKAVTLVEAAGYTVCQIEYRGSTAYILDSDGAYRKIGRKP